MPTQADYPYWDSTLGWEAQHADGGELTIAGGAITLATNAPLQTYSVLGEGAAADDLDTITGGVEGMLVVLRPGNAAQDITVKHGTGNLVTSDGSDYAIPDNGFALLHYDGANWRLLATGGGGSGSSTFTGLTDTPANYTGQTGNYLRVNAGETALEFVAPPAGTKPDQQIDFRPGSFDLFAADPAPYGVDTGAFGSIGYHAFDDTTQEYVEGVFTVPSDLDTAGTVTFRATGYAATAAASRYVQLSFEHSAASDSDSWDVAYTAEDSGDLETDGTQDELDAFSWTETVSNLGWAAGDQVRFKVSRKAPSGTNLTGDWRLTHLRVSIPRA